MTTITDDAVPPPYTKTARPQRPTPTITILLLGSPGVGKSTFLSALPHVRNGRLEVSRTNPDAPSRVVVPNPSSFSVSLFNRPYDIVIHRSESTLFVDPFPSKIDFVIFCYAIDSRESLYNAQYYWHRQFVDRYEKDLGLTVPVMLIGLKRDLRTDKKVMVDTVANIAQVGGKEVGAQSSTASSEISKDAREEYACVMPDQGMVAAQKMRCDRYAECSAITGELMWEVLEDITRTAALTTTDKGGFSESNCAVM